jgi:hypothetical protein
MCVCVCVYRFCHAEADFVLRPDLQNPLTPLLEAPVPSFVKHIIHTIPCKATFRYKTDIALV